MKIREALLNLLFPPKCPFCGKVMDSVGICPACEENLPWTRDAETLQEGPGDFCCAAPLWYEDLAREGLLRFKFQGGSAAAEPLGELLARCAAEQFSGRFDTVTWIPLSPSRLRKRGYDQVELLARAVCRHWDTRPERLLEKTADNPPQSGLTDPAARRANVLGVYEVPDPEQVRGRRILLLDDICTTGATLREAVRELKAAGAAEVVCGALAFTREKTPGKGQKS